MEHAYPPKVFKTLEALLSDSATLPLSLRQALVARAGNLVDKVRPLESIPPELATYLEKVLFYAYRTTDEDVKNLKEAGYTEDQIFEITLCAAFGTGLARMRRGLEAMKGEVE